jgi:large subunit ribosomal protein L22
MITASLKNYRITPRKMRIVADMIRGKKVEEAKDILTHVVKKAGDPILALMNSAISNAKNNFKIEKDVLCVKEIRVDQGYVLRRSLPMSRGSAFPLKKRTSHVQIVLAEVENKKSKKIKSKK